MKRFTKKSLLVICFIALLTSNEAFALKNKNTETKAGDENIKESNLTKQIAVGGFADIVENLLPTVVNISTTQEFSNNGTGFIISSDGYIATSNHVIEDSNYINVALSDGSKYKAQIIGADKKTDLAILKINVNSAKILTPVKFGDSKKARIGDWVIVIGNQYGLGGSVSVGIISARSRNINNLQDNEFIQTDAAINKGNSGGPLFNINGEVIGISTALFSPSGGNVGIGFASPIESAAPILKQLKEQGEVVRGWIGVSVQSVTNEMAESLGVAGENKLKGVLVTDITKDGPADKAGIIASDIITKIGTQEILEVKSLPQIISQSTVGKNVALTLLRRGKARVVNVRIAKMPSEDSKIPLKRTAD